MLETLAAALRRVDPTPESGLRRLRPVGNADELSAEIVERIADSLSQRNLLLLHGTLAMDFHDTLVSYYTEWLPDIHPSEEGYRALAAAWQAALAPLLGAADRPAAP